MLPLPTHASSTHTHTGAPAKQTRSLGRVLPSHLRVWRGPLRGDGKSLPSCSLGGLTAEGGRRPPSLTHRLPDTYPQLFNLGKSQTAQVIGRDCQRSFSPSCALPLTGEKLSSSHDLPRWSARQTQVPGSPCPPVPGQAAFQIWQVDFSKLPSPSAPDPTHASGLDRRLSLAVEPSCASQ